MKKLSLLVGLLVACGSVGSGSNDLWTGNVRHSPDMLIECKPLSSMTFKLVIRNDLTKAVCATVVTSVPVGFMGTQEVNPDSVYSCSAVPGNKEILYSVNVDGTDLPLVTSMQFFSDYPNANHLYLAVDTNIWDDCKDNKRAVDLNANWTLTR